MSCGALSFVSKFSKWGISLRADKSNLKEEEIPHHNVIEIFLFLIT
jgi:hypothetical protein